MQNLSRSEIDNITGGSFKSGCIALAVLGLETAYAAYAYKGGAIIAPTIFVISATLFGVPTKFTNEYEATGNTRKFSDVLWAGLSGLSMTMAFAGFGLGLNKRSHIANVANVLSSGSDMA